MEAENEVSRKWLLSTSSDDQVEENLTNNESKLTQEDFDFGSGLPKETKMCSADEVFFQGRILSTCNSEQIRSSSWPGSMEHVAGEGGEGTRTCRSGNSCLNNPIYKQRMRNHFHSHHPSPKPQLRCSRIKNQNSKSTMWSHFRVGLATTPDIELEDLKVRSTKTRRSSDQHKHVPMSRAKQGKGGSDSCSSNKKKRQGLFDISGCICDVNSVVIVPYKASKRNEAKEQQEKNGNLMSGHPKFQWLNQLSLESTQVQ